MTNINNTLKHYYISARPHVITSKNTGNPHSHCHKNFKSQSDMKYVCQQIMSFNMFISLATMGTYYLLQSCTVCQEQFLL
jgi:hypothetical protein